MQRIIHGICGIWMYMSLIWFWNIMKKYLSCMPLGARALPSWRSPRLMPIQTKIRKQIHRVSLVLGYWFFSGSCCQTVLPIQRSGWITHQHPRVWPGLLCNYLPICVLWDSTLICFTEGLNLPFPKFWHLIIWQNTAKDVLKTTMKTSQTTSALFIFLPSCHAACSATAVPTSNANLQVAVCRPSKTPRMS